MKPRRWISWAPPGEGTPGAIWPRGENGMKTVMVVDDDPICCALLTAFLDSRGYQAVPVPDSYTALDILESGRPIDLAVIDIVMPPGHPHGYALAAMASLRRKD